jgi:hypothetical protein
MTWPSYPIETLILQVVPRLRHVALENRGEGRGEPPNTNSNDQTERHPLLQLAGREGAHEAEIGEFGGSDGSELQDGRRIFGLNV